MIGDSRSNSDPTFVGERGDDQPGGSSKILVPVVHGGTDLLDQTVIPIFKIIP